MITITNTEVQDMIKKELGVNYLAEDHKYFVPKDKEFYKSRMQRLLGLKENFYIAEGYDCDNSSLDLRYMFKKRFFNKYIKSFGTKNGQADFPDVFVEEIKVRYPGACTPHWFVVAIALDKEGKPNLIYRERTSTDIVIPPSGWEVVKVK